MRFMSSPENQALLLEGKYRCTRCNRVKPVRLFYRRKTNNSGISSHCIACAKKENAGRSHDAVVQRMYGLAPGEYEERLQQQGGVCYLCGMPPRTKRLAVDHNHKNGKVRGLLCARCNQILGQWGDDPIIADRAAAYLRNDGMKPKPEGLERYDC